MIAENGIAEKDNWSGEWEMTLLFGSTEISAEKCNWESFLLFGTEKNSTENCTQDSHSAPHEIFADYISLNQINNQHRPQKYNQQPIFNIR